MRLNKGSKEAKLYMAKIRAKRNKATVGSLPFTGEYYGVKLLVTSADDGVSIKVGNKVIMYRKGDTQGATADKIAKAIKSQQKLYNNLTDKEMNELKRKFSLFVGTLKSELPTKAVKQVKVSTPVKRTVVAIKSVQRGKSNTLRDEMYKAKAPGKRKSKTGKTYYESRKNRSDAPGQLTGTSENHKDSKSHNVNIRVVSGINNYNDGIMNEIKGLLRFNEQLLIYIDRIKKGEAGKTTLGKSAILRYKQNIAYNKKRITDLKKLIK